MKMLKQWVWPVLAGFLVASVIMLVFEWINHFIFPKPAGLDVMDPVALRAFTASLPWRAYILVFVGWAFGAFEGGCTTAWLAKEKQLPATTILAVFLVVAGYFDMTTLGFPLVSMILGIILLAVFPYLGRFALNTFEKKKRGEIAAMNAGNA